jgi:hypothetical protein
VHSVKRMMRTVAAVALGLGASAGVAARAGAAVRGSEAQQTAAQSGVTRSIGTIKSIIGNTITLTTDAGTDVTVTVSDATKMVQVAPGQKTLQGATAIHLSDLQVGDRILVLARASSGNGPLSAGSIIAMKKSAVDAQHAQQSTEWQRGVGGLVKSVDPTSGAITITMASLSGTKTVEIHTTKDTILRRYAPDSVNFDDAKTGTIDQIHAGDQLRARGTRSTDGSEFDAQEIVSGAFRNIAGTITAIDVSANTVSVNDLISKKSFLVKFTPQSEIRQLSPQMAQGIAMRLRMAQNAGQAGNAGGGAMAANRGAGGPPGQRPAGFQRGGGSGDLTQFLNRLPAATLANLQKGEAVMIVSTEGAVSGEVTAITLLGGVEPILEAPSGMQAMTLSPWSLGGAPSEGDDQP